MGEISNIKKQIEKLFNENEEQTRRIAKALKEKDEASLLDAIRKGEGTLEGMGVVSANVLPFIRSMERAGGAAKILGGGGKKDGVGFLLCYHPDAQIVGAIASKFGFSAGSVHLGGDGVRLERKK